MTTSVTTYPGPAGEVASDLYQVRINGEPLFVYQARVSAVPFNQVWPGYQRPIDQTELAAFAVWAADGPVEVVVESARPVESVVVRPKSYGITPHVQGNTISFTLDQPRYLTVEVNGYHQALHLFSDAPETDLPDPADPKVHYYGPGVHQVGVMELGSGETVYIAGGAIVHGSLRAQHARDIKIIGRGMIDVSSLERSVGGGAVRLYGCENVLIDGLVMRDPNVWTVTPVACRNVHISNLKLVGLWRYNSDGIDLVNCQHAVIERCFVRAYDDNIVLKGLRGRGDQPSGDLPLEDVLVKDCVLWNDWGRPLEIGAETVAPAMRDITFQNCDIIHCAHVALDIQHGDRAKIENVRYENIRIEFDDGAPRPVMQENPGEVFPYDPNEVYCPRLFVAEIHSTYYSRDTERGWTKGVLVKDVTVEAPCTPPSFLVGYDDEHPVADVTFQNLRINGELITDAAQGGFELRDHVRNVRFIE